MWNPRRLLILVGAFALLLAGYLVYASFLGGIDGLPPLPSEYHPPAPGEMAIVDLPPEPEGDRKMRLAFGPDCEEVKRNHKLDLRSKGWVIAAEKFDIVSDGRVKLTPFSAALFPKSQVPGRSAGEITLVQCEEALLTLDRPVTGAMELTNRKVIGIELRSRQSITLINNRGTLEKNDDIELLISGGPLFFDERRHLIWTEGFIKLVDKQSRPHPMQVTAKGLDIQLAKDPPKPKAPKEKTGADQAGFVDLLVLRANVEMHVWVDSTAGFLATGASATPATAAATPVEKSQLIIKTPGTFTYNVPKDIASFDGPAGSSTDCEVHVSREHEAGGAKRYDQLLCDQLVLQFRRKAVLETARDGRNLEKAKEIESAKATARPGKELVLTMDSEKLEAYGNELVYQSATFGEGPKTILKGRPMHAVKEGHKVEAVELHLISEKTRANRVLAVGPGRIDLYDKAKDRYALHATWKTSLTSAKERDGDKVLDLLTLTGDAGFLDEEHAQELRGERIIVWLESLPSQEQKQPEEPKESFASRQKPVKIEAYDNVRAESAEFRVLRAGHLEIRFTSDAFTQKALNPEAQGRELCERTLGNVHENQIYYPEGVASSTLMQPLWGRKTGLDPAFPGCARKASRPWALGCNPFGVDTTYRLSNYSPQLASSDPTKKRKPIELEARRIVCYVSRGSTKDELKELVTEGSVRVRQEGNDAKDKGLEIQGEMLNVVRHKSGDILYVFGDSRKPAQLQLGELIVIGPKVTINQGDNTADVQGVGAMSFPSGSTTFEGNRPARPGSRITVHWTKEMIFNGQYANFYGGVMAYQDNAFLKCQNLQVKLDREVSFKEGQKGGPSPKVDKLICELKVYIKDEIKDASNRYIHHHRLEASQLEVDNQAGKTHASGPGRVLSLSQRGAGAGGGGPQPYVPTAQGGKGPDLMLTRIDYTGRFWSTTLQDGSRLSTFIDNVEVYHTPADNPDAPVNPDRPSKDGFYLRCDKLEVWSRKRDGKTSQVMQAQNRVLFRTQDFFGRADVVKYDEAQDQIIFEGSSGSPAILSKTNAGQGRGTQDVKATKILYNRRQGTFQLDGGKVISSW